jgi:hypothetical protein
VAMTFSNFPVGDWRLFSMPLVHEDNLISTLLEPRLGAYSSATWKIMRQGTRRNEFLEYRQDPSFTRLVPGECYYLLLNEPKSFEITAVEPSRSAPFLIPLQSGWNYVSNPFNQEFAWDDMQIFNDMESMNIVQAALTQSWIRDDIYWYEGNRYLKEKLGNPEILPFKPWAGYMIYARESGLELAVPAHLLTSQGKAMAAASLSRPMAAALALPGAKTQSAVQGQQGYYLMDAFGGLHTLGQLQEMAAPYFQYDIVRDLAPTVDGKGYLILNGFGGVHGVGRLGDLNLEGLPQLEGDLARRLEVASDGVYVMDEYGQIHSSKGATKFEQKMLFEEPIARAFAVISTGFDLSADRQISQQAATVSEKPHRAASPDEEGRHVRGYYLMDAHGRVFANGDLPLYEGPLFDEPVAWDFALAVDGRGYYILDGYGMVHVCGPATRMPGMSSGPKFENDIARRLVIAEAGYGILDKFGKVHAFGRFPDPPETPPFGFEVARDLVPSIDKLFGRLEVLGKTDEPGGDPHWFMKDETRCLWCHLDKTAEEPPEHSLARAGKFTARFRLDMDKVCLSCHGQSKNEHPIGVIPTTSVPGDLPLNDRGEMSCLTCHAAHAPQYSDRNWVSVSFMDRVIRRSRLKRTFYLRRNNVQGDLCFACHDVIASN